MYAKSREGIDAQAAEFVNEKAALEKEIERLNQQHALQMDSYRQLKDEGDALRKQVAELESSGRLTTMQLEELKQQSQEHQSEVQRYVTNYQEAQSYVLRAMLRGA